MSYGGFEYNQGGFGYGGFDVMSGFGNDLSGGGFLGNQDGGKVQEKKVISDLQIFIREFSLPKTNLH